MRARETMLESGGLSSRCLKREDAITHRLAGAQIRVSARLFARHSAMRGETLSAPCEIPPGTGVGDNGEEEAKNYAGYRCESERPTHATLFNTGPYSFQVNVFRDRCRNSHARGAASKAR